MSDLISDLLQIVVGGVNVDFIAKGTSKKLLVWVNTCMHPDSIKLCELF